VTRAFHTFSELHQTHPCSAPLLSSSPHIPHYYSASLESLHFITTYFFLRESSSFKFPSLILSACPYVVIASSSSYALYPCAGYKLATEFHNCEMDHSAAVLEAARLNAVNVGQSKEPAILKGKQQAYSSQGPQSSASRERRRRFPVIDNKPLLNIPDTPPTFDRFTFSPLSPKAFPTRNAEDWENLPGRGMLLERYLDSEDSQAPIIRDPASKPAGVPISPITRPPAPAPPQATQACLTLATTGIADALPTPGQPTNLWAVFSVRQNPSQARDSMTRVDPRIPPPPPPPPSYLASLSMNHEKSRNSNGISIHPPSILPNSDGPSIILHYHQQVCSSESETSGCSLYTPPPAPTSLAFSNSIPQLTICIDPSPFDPPPAPRLSRFPLEFPASPSISGPAPIDTSLICHKKRISELTSPVLPEERSKAIEASTDPPPAPTLDSFPLEFPPSPRRSKPAPIDTTPPSPASTLGSKEDITPTQPPRAPVVRDFVRQPKLALKTVRFANAGPEVSRERSLTHGAYSPSPPFYSPITPVAMTNAFPFIKSPSSSPEPPSSPATFQVTKEADTVTISSPRGRQSWRTQDGQPRARTHSPARSTPLEDESSIALLPATVYEPTVIYNPRTNSSTVIPSPLLPQYKSYTINNVTASDRNRILDAYFHRGRKSA
jgi:hypothetical protein